MAQRGLEIRAPGSTRVIQAPTAQERREIPQSSFLGFIDEKRELFAGLFASQRALRVTEEEWRSSPRLDSLLDEQIELIQAGPHGGLDPKRISTFRERYKNSFLRGEQSPLTSDDVNHFKGKITSGLAARWNDVSQRQEQFYNEYQAARQPLVETIVETRQALLAQLAEYLRAEFKHLFDFRDFLTDSKLVSMREQIRPFLVSLAEHVFKSGDKQGNMLAQLQREWTERTKDIIMEANLRFFLLSPDKGIGPNFFELIKFAVGLMRPDENIKDEYILRTLERAPLSIWPEDVRMGYQKCSAARIASVIDGIRKGLEPYRKFS